MAGYAALTSLMHIVKQLQEYGRDLIILDKGQIESLGQKVGFLQDFLETYSNIASKEAEILENQIAESAYAAEDVIESHVINRIHTGSRRFMRSSSAVLCNLDEVTENFDTIAKSVMDITKDNQRFKVHNPENSMPTRSTSIGKITMVGLDEELLRVMDWLTGGNHARQTISIVGMGGIGKTTLARSVFEKPLIVKHFDIHIWATVSQQYSRHKILSEMVLCLNGKEGGGGDLSGNDENQLGEMLHKSLSGRRYLVVMDDMWNIEAWDMVRFFLPDNGNGSRVIVTTRQSEMASHFGRCCLNMEFLDKDKSWDLFCQTAFGHETCPSELEEDGKVIVEKCKGLPLSIVVIAGLLRNSSRTQEYWKSASDNINPSTLNSEDDDHCMKILSLSYNYLPVHLKPCFLYMGLFPEDHEIHVSQLVKLWVAEGFLKLNGSRSSEDVAEGYLLDLVNRNLVLVGRRRHNGCIKTCRIHDLLRDLCVRIVSQGKFLCLLRTSGNNIPQDADKGRCIVVHEPELRNIESESIVESPMRYQSRFFRGLQTFFSFFCASFTATFSLFTNLKSPPPPSSSSSTGNHFKLLEVLQSASLCRTLMCNFDEGHHRLPSSRLLRVCNTNVDKFSPKAVFKLVNLRYLSFKPHCFSGFVARHSFPPLNPGTTIPSTISLLWNVQTIIFRGLMERFILPSEIWFMSQLRHIEFDEISLPDQAEGHGDLVLENLETLSNVVKFRCDEKMVKRIPNIKKLKITYYNVSMYYDNITDVRKAELINGLAGSYDSLEHLDCLGKLESLNLCFHGSPQQSDSLHRIAFPRSLKKLTLAGTRLEWADMTTIGSLPNLEVLVLEVYSVAGSEWNLAEGDFPCLKVLKIHDSELEHLNADETHFPALESLVFENLETLDEIPLSIGYIPTLESIDLYLCSDSAVASSKKLLEEQQGNGNEDIQVRVTFRNGNQLENFMVEMEFESLASDNFQVVVLVSSYDEL